MTQSGYVQIEKPRIDVLREERMAKMRQAIEYAKDAEALGAKMFGDDHDKWIPVLIRKEVEFLYRLKRDAICECARLDAEIKAEEAKLKAGKK